ncbi:DUF2946 domain-containing protein [Tepidimonas alkaliphilus]|uniref:DUF2946 domain-containing protein n=1 Tax=Tepidimonas alkaliphilus TaxID=2588942 RepID=UPI00117E8E92
MDWAVLRGVSPRWRSTLLWGLVGVMLWAAIAPSVSRWLQLQRGVWAEVCSAQGTRWMLLPAEAPDSTSQNAPDPHEPACGYCLLPWRWPALPVDPALVLAPLWDVCGGPIAVRQMGLPWIDARPGSWWSRAPPRRF